MQRHAEDGAYADMEVYLLDDALVKAADALTMDARWDGEVATVCARALDGRATRADVGAALAALEEHVAAFKARAIEVVDHAERHGWLGEEE